MIAVQAEGCAPVVRAFEENEPRSRFFDGAHTLAAGLRVPKRWAISWCSTRCAPRAARRSR